MTANATDAPLAVVAGHICLDIIPDLGHVRLAGPEQFFQPGKLLNTGAAYLGTGGPVSNTGLALIRLGIRTALMGKLGDDPFGLTVRQLLRDRWGVGEGFIVQDGAVTSYSVVLIPGSFDRMFLHCPGANDTFCAADVNYDLVGRAKLFHFGYPPLMQRMYENDGEELVEIYRRVKALGVTTSLDMSLPDPDSPSGRVNWRAILERLLPFVDICMPSAEETLFMLDRDEFLRRRSAGGDLIESFTGEQLHEFGEALLSMGTAMAGIKCGHRGFYLRTASAERLGRCGAAALPANAWAGREMWHPTFRAERLVSTTGSGDATIAGFLSAILRGYGPPRAMQCAVATGACNVSAPDALGGLRDWDEMLGLVDAGWPTNALTLSGPGWRTAEDSPLWLGPAEK